MEIDKIELRHLSIPLKEPFQTSSETKDHIEHIIVMVYSGDMIGFGECTCNQTPYYIYETTHTAWHILTKFIVPHMVGLHISTIDDLLEHPKYKAIKGNNFAKAGLELAVWDLIAKGSKISLSKALGGTKEYIESGVSIGIQKDIPTLLKKIEGFLEQGYKRIKLKIKPGFDYEFLKAVRETYPDLPIMADANSAYTLNDVDLFIKMDGLNLMMYEQPLGYDDIVDHSKLQMVIKTPICLDESIHSVEDARKAIELGSCRVINIKIGRVGGLSESKKIHDLCMENDIPVWCGGMHEYGIGRAHNKAINSLPNFRLPGDVAGSDKYWHQDILEPEFVIKDGCIDVPKGAGIGVEPKMDIIEKYTINNATFK